MFLFYRGASGAGKPRGRLVGQTLIEINYVTAL